jgi:hypothetical protein
MTSSTSDDILLSSLYRRCVHLGWFGGCGVEEDQLLILGEVAR